MTESLFKNKSIFISRSISDDSPFKHAKAQGCTVIDESLIKIVKIPFSYTPQTKWIFFSSKNAIKYFFSQLPSVSNDVKYGVISDSSAQYLLTYNKVADFIGSGTDLKSIGVSFANVLKNDSVLFPQSMDSLRTIQKQIAYTNTLYNLYTYKTIIRTDFDIPYTDVVIFTSPSNVEAYLNKYKIDSRQLVIAMGTSTKFKLSEFGIKNVTLASNFSEEGLFESILLELNS